MNQRKPLYKSMHYNLDMLNYYCVTSVIKLNSNRKSDKGNMLTKQIMNFNP